ncbi:hypothetical protein TNCV_2543751 [Trichonephila clavipes]|nr:hypothetical protein TNCV_2543751 [Trichonephila clavipes]
MIVGNSSQVMVLPQEDQVPEGHVSILRGRIRRTAVATALSEAPCSVHSTDSKPLPFATPVVSSQSSLEDGMETFCVFLLKAGSALVPVMAECWSEGGQGNMSATKLSAG